MIWLLVGLAAVADDAHAVDPSVWCSDPVNALGGYCIDYFDTLRNQTSTDLPLPTTSTSTQDDENIPTTATTDPRPITAPSTTTLIVDPTIVDPPIVDPVIVDPASVPHDNFVRLAL